MARTKATLGQGVRLTDHLGASLFARVYPMDVVTDLLEKHECNSQRVRRFPASTAVYFSMALSLYPEAAYEDVFAAMTQGLSWLQGTVASSTIISKASITEARAKIGYAVLRDLQAQYCPALAVMEQHPEGFYAGLRLVAMDGSSFDVPDEQANADTFGYPEGGRGPAGYPKAQCAVLVECGTHAILAGSIGAYRDAEWTLCQSLLPTLNSTMLCMADRGFNGFEHWQQASQTGAQLLWRVAKSRNFPVTKELEDGSFLSTIYRRDKKNELGPEAIEVRVIEYALPNMPESEPRYRLMTTLLDPCAAPAQELAAIYHARWEVESVFDELKTHLRQSRRVLRSKTPDLVRQEFYGWMLAHYAIRWLMHSAARQGKKSPLELSFIGNVHLFRRAQPQSGAFSPSEAEKAKAVVRTTVAKCKLS